MAIEVNNVPLLSYGLDASLLSVTLLFFFYQDFKFAYVETWRNLPDGNSVYDFHFILVSTIISPQLVR